MGSIDPMLRKHAELVHRVSGEEAPTHYSAEQIAEFNRQHDQKYGFSPNCAAYTNPQRRPETVFGDIIKHWQERG